MSVMNALPHAKPSRNHYGGQSLAQIHVYLAQSECTLGGILAQVRPAPSSPQGGVTHLLKRPVPLIQLRASSILVYYRIAWDTFRTYLRTFAGVLKEWAYMCGLPPHSNDNSKRSGLFSAGASTGCSPLHQENQLHIQDSLRSCSQCTTRYNSYRNNVIFYK